MTKLTSLSVFFPFYNEEENIKPTIDRALLVIPTMADEFELIIVDDGSTDGTNSIAQELAASNDRIRVITHSSNLGYGAAVKSGITAARFEWVFFSDGDLQFDLEELASFITHAQDFDVIIGYRRNRAEGFKRHLNAQLFKLFIDILFRVNVKDIDCAFKLFKTELVQSLPLESNGAFTSAELLYRLKKKKIHFQQLPVNHYPRKYGNPTGANIGVILRAGYEAIKLYIRIKYEMIFG